MKIDNQQEFNLLRKISKKPNANQRELASDLNISLGKLNYVLKELKNKGLVKINNFNNSNNKLNYAYILTPKGIKEKTAITKQFIIKKKQEYDKLNSYINK